MSEDLATIQDRLNRVITALLIERSGEENSLRWGGPAIADLVADDERWMMDLLRDTVNASTEVHEQVLSIGERLAEVSDADVRLYFDERDLPAGPD